MGAVLVTVAGPSSRIDVSLPADAPVGEVLPALVGRCEADPQPWSRWALGRPGCPPFSPWRTLAELGVVDGAELQLCDMVAPGDVMDEGSDAGRASGTAEAEARRRSVSHLTERLVSDIARIRAGRNPLLEYAAPEARSRLRALAPGPFDRAAEAGCSDLCLAVSWHRDPGAPVEALASFTEIGGPGGSARTPTSGATPPRRMRVRMTVDPHCESLLDVSVEVGSPPR
ncbi:MAG: EsaB/YukD family protein [Candidatus Dormibacteria bacterium]|jgi:hypothetical protein